MKQLNLFILIITAAFSCYNSALGQSQKIYTYKVAAGDTLKSISNKHYGTTRRWQEIQQANIWVDPAQLQVGDKLIIPHMKEAPALEQQKDLNALTLKKIRKRRKLAKRYHLESKKFKKQLIKIAQKTSVADKSPEENWQFQYEELLTEHQQLQSNYNDLKLAQMTQKLTSPTAMEDEKILQEKNEILAQRLWVEKNKDLGKCQLTFQSVRGNTEDEFKKLVFFLQDELGADKVVVDGVENKISFYLQGHSVRGVRFPYVSDIKKEFLNKITNKFHRLPIERIHIVGQSHKKTVRDSRGKVTADTIYSLNQATAIKDWFVHSQGLAPALFTVGTIGKVSGQSLKRFEIGIYFKHKKSISRQISSKLPEMAYLDDSIARLKKYGRISAEVKNAMINITIARSDVIKDYQLTPKGKILFRELLSKFEKVKDSRFVLNWIPGLDEVKNTTHQLKVFRSLDQIKKHFEIGYPWMKDELQVSFDNAYGVNENTSLIGNDIPENNKLVLQITPHKMIQTQINSI